MCVGFLIMEVYGIVINDNEIDKFHYLVKMIAINNTGTTENDLSIYEKHNSYMFNMVAAYC